MRKMAHCAASSNKHRSFTDLVQLFHETLGLGFTSESEVTVDESTRKITFLDVDLLISTSAWQRDLSFNIHHKKTQSFCYLRFHSNHHPQTLAGVVVGLATRVYRICSSQFRPMALAELREKLHRHGYPPDLVARGFHKARAEFYRKKCPKLAGAEQKPINIPLIIKTENSDHPALPVVKGLLKNLAEEAEQPWRCQVAYRRGANILEKVTKGRKCLIQEQTFRIKRCGTCKFCDTLKICDHISASRGKLHQVPRKNLTCRSEGVIYLVRCGCEKSYVGRTIRQAQKRISEHLSSIKILQSKIASTSDNNDENTEEESDDDFGGGGKTRKRFYEHMAKCDQAEHYEWFILDKIHSKERFTMEATERKYIKLFRPSLNTQLAY